jgi:hypothetical protein
MRNRYEGLPVARNINANVVDPNELSDEAAVGSSKGYNTNGRDR